MNERMDILKSLVSLSDSLDEISSGLAKFDWDYEGNPLVVKSQQIIEVLQRHISGKVDVKDIERWANMLECREDIEFDESNEEQLENVIYCLANPELEGAINVDLCKQFVRNLS
ncbi:MAG: hypothetical protein RPU37_00485 [Candidatus Sedimenticola sp. (ex Thyasira tokunagai)]